MQTEEEQVDREEEEEEEEWALAVFNFPGQTAEDLSFQHGALIRVLQHLDSDWRRGRLEGREGLYPVAFTKPYPAQPIPGEQPAGGGVAKALFDFTAESEDELTLKIGDIIREVESLDEQWIMGVVGGKRGIVPKNYISLLLSEEQALGLAFLSTTSHNILAVGQCSSLEVEAGWRWRWRAAGWRCADGHAVAVSIAGPARVPSSSGLSQESTSPHWGTVRVPATRGGRGEARAVARIQGSTLARRREVREASTEQTRLLGGLGRRSNKAMISQRGYSQRGLQPAGATASGATASGGYSQRGLQPAGLQPAGATASGGYSQRGLQPAGATASGATASGGYSQRGYSQRGLQPAGATASGGYSQRGLQPAGATASGGYSQRRAPCGGCRWTRKALGVVVRRAASPE
ncbi:hypothetical protein CRUP_008687 [Coryphaenoides rupestris]|nr:hypothetical protein CRUP_008687 [Coryphaenoides rupestris]